MANITDGGESNTFKENETLLVLSILYDSMRQAREQKGLQHISQLL